jgi:acyl carrier protein
MSEVEDRLVRCFSSVFPALTPEEIRTSGAKSLAEWDSLTAVTLVAVVEQEFSVQIDLFDVPEPDSFEAFQSYLCRLTARGTDGNQ